MEGKEAEQWGRLETARARNKEILGALGGLFVQVAPVSILELRINALVKFLLQDDTLAQITFELEYETDLTVSLEDLLGAAKKKRGGIQVASPGDLQAFEQSKKNGGSSRP